ncbi:T9SS C-terminal target domain-containing protein [Chryseobacterium bernardetii]|uniref:T9SS C-terminal target domain-containing protein n=1 Tax=Chryseobacterium bernardetii TaxID=1241978 RepID=A0A3G6TM83_9FLAO|nr:T9SS C-terminal target domain-containing protein [Chryseobacterium bernardetii]AZB36305.1 T9SS C-terminal target domain-containing protein [Chryseobacterium bernardetii]
MSTCFTIQILIRCFHLYDQSGKLVKSKEVVRGENKIDISELPDGAYLMKTESESYKIIKKN